MGIKITAKWNTLLTKRATFLSEEVISRNIPKLHIQVAIFNRKKVLFTVFSLFLWNTKPPIISANTALIMHEI